MNKMWSRLITGGVALLRGILCFLVFVSFTLTMASFSLHGVLAHREPYHRAAQDEALVAEMVAFVRPDLENECLFYGLPLEIVDETVSADMAAAFLDRYVDEIYDAAFVDGQLDVPTVDAALFRAPIAARLSEEGVEDKIIDDLAAEFAAVTTASWQMGLSQTLLTPVHRVVSHVWVQRFLNGGKLLAGVTALLAGICLLLGWKRIRRQVFDLLSGLTVGSMMLYVPLWLLHRYGLAQRLALGDTPLRHYVIRLVDILTDQATQLMMWTLIVCAVLTVAAVVWVVWPQKETAAATTAEIVPEEA